MSHERSRSQELTNENQALNASLRQMQGQMLAMTDKLNTLASQSAPAPVRKTEPARVHAARTTARVVARTSPRSDPGEARMRRIETDLANQQKEIDGARQQSDQNRQELEGKLNSQHDELSGSIAKNHDELAAMEKRGERNYYEFDLSKSKQFQRIGPVSLSVRKVDLKHRYYDLMMMVDDQQIEKKHVDLYEPLMLTPADRAQPIELVVNGIKRNEVKGYVSEPKYKQSELASPAPAQSSPQTPQSQTLQKR